MTRIHASNRSLSYDGDADCALDLIESVRQAYSATDMPRVLHDFLLNIEAELQHAGVLDEDFARVAP